jgi:hypothetical protein
MNRQYFTMNPATPHPDSENDTAPTLDEAIKAALEILRKEGASMYARRSAAFDLADAYTAHKDTAA